MQIDIRHDGPKWIVYVWDDDELQDEGQPVQHGVYTEDIYIKMNDWCIKTLGVHSRSAYNVFEFRKKCDLDWFILRWN